MFCGRPRFDALRRTVPESIKTDELDEIIDWLGETVRQTDSSLLDEWEALTDPDAAQRVADREPVAPARPITGNERAFTEWSATPCSSGSGSPRKIGPMRWATSTPPMPR